MFVSEALKTHLETSATIRLQSLVLAEWNMNMPDNLQKVGNYRYRPTDVTSQYFTLPISFDLLDQGNYYTGATDADVVIDGGFTNNNVPQQFTLQKDKMKMIYSLEDCTKPFRPRSGINKPLYFSGRYIANSGADMAERPRYYMPSRYDEFRYWTSYRTEDNFERGIANNILNGLNYIDDTVPFVVYKNQVPTNRLVVKMQTNVGSVNLGPFATSTGPIADQLFGNANKTTPSRWKVQYLINNNWENAYSFNEADTRADGSPIIGPNGYVELQYGLIVPEQYRNIFVYAETLASVTLRPDEAPVGYAYLVIPTSGNKGTFYIYTGTGEDGGYQSFVPEYGWILGSETITNQTNFVTDLTSPEQFIDQISGQTVYREFAYIQGIRVVVDIMNKFDSTFDLIEMSPRLVVDISDKVIDFNITKTLSDIGVTSLPVGQLLASTGSLSIFDDDQAFNFYNNTSIVADYIRKNIKFNFYEVIVDVDGFDYYVPIKTLYSEGMPQANVTSGTINITLRDLYFFLESMPAPRLLMTETSLSMAIVTLLDYIGFSNYSFRRLNTESDPVIPYFFVAPDQNVAEVLNQLAVATQSAMFFDEFNNFIVMSKNYLMPNTTERPTSFVLSGTNNQTDSGVVENATSGNLPNIISIASEDKKVYNGGNISYTARYIQRSYGSIRQASMVDRDKTWIYKPALLWEVAGTDNTKTINEVASKQGKYVLGAMPLNSDLTASLPVVQNGIVINNIMDIGENVYWLTRYQGYFYSGGEVIRYDAAEFNVTLPIWYPVKSDGTLDETKPQIVLPGKLAPVEITLEEDIRIWRNSNRQGSSNVWISSNQEYQKYFASLPFNGKIYPTGLIRIFSTPYYETVDGISRLQRGAVYEHGRGQFGTPIVTHTAGINQYWSDNAYVRGCDMQTQYLFTTSSLDPVFIKSVKSSGNVFYVNEISGVSPGDTVNLLSGTGQLSTSAETKVSAVNTQKAKATITNISTLSGTITYTAQNTFSPGQTISIAGVTPNAYNLSNVVVVAASSSSFTISNASTGAYVSGGIATSQVFTFTVTTNPATALNNATIEVSKIPNTNIGAAGVNNTLAKQTTRNGIIKNFMSSKYLTETDVNSLKSTQTGTIQSSAFVMNGPSFKTTDVPLNFVSYQYKQLDNAYKTFGARMRIIGKIENNETRGQTPIGSVSYYQVNGAQTNQNVSIGGGSGGLAIMLNPETNNGYYFEIIALTETNIESYLKLDVNGQAEVNINNVVFYKVKKDASSNNAIPVKLWGGLTSIIVDDGRFTGQYRLSGEDKPTVYDLSVEYEDIGTLRRFYLYINNKLVKIVDDTEPLPVYNNIAPFIRGSSRVMFENLYAITNNYSQNTVSVVGETLSDVFGDSEIDANESFRKYAISGLVQGTYLTGISSGQPPRYNMYFEEFGSIMRECAYFDIKYDRSYPALYAQLSPTFNRIKGYTVSGFQADSYGAEFLIFNASDTALNLDETTGNYLRIQGITFTQDTSYQLTVDEYFKKQGNLSDPELQGSTLITSPLVEKAKYDEIKLSRLIYGKNDFSIETPYIQSQDDANELMGWIINKVMRPKKSIGINLFSIPTLQLGDIVTIDYKNNDNLDLVAQASDRFVVYNIAYNRTLAGPSMTVYLSEV